MKIPKEYKSKLTLKQTEKAIKQIKDFFQLNLATELRLRRVSAPLFVKKGTGVNDDLNGIESCVSFGIKDMDNTTAEIVNSLAKWKRMMLADYHIASGYGLYTDMNAIRPDEKLDNIHSLYVDQWDWERVISEKEKGVDLLKRTVKSIYSAIKRTEFLVYEHYPEIVPSLPEEITFIHSEELLNLYPELPSEERENRIAEKHGAVFVIGIGGELSNGAVHDGRAPDYDDWTTETQDGRKGLNGDLIVWNSILESGYEISSMGIRVDPQTLEKQLKITGLENRRELMWHKRLLNGEYPLSIGGGIGQSRLCMFLLKKAHIGEVQSSIWPDYMKDICKKNDLKFL